MFPAFRWLLLLSLLLTLVGCRSNRQQQQALIERELRLQEDRIFQLEDELAETVAMLDSTRRENSSLRNELVEVRGGGSGSRNVPTPARPPQIELGPPGDDPGFPAFPDGDAPYYAPPLPETDDLEPGVLEPGTAPDVLAPLHDDLDGAPTYVPQSRSEGTYGSGNVAKITLNKRLTGGHDRDGQPGDEGLMVVIEPRNENDELLEVPGALSIVVTDPTRSGPGGRVARWDFSEDEAGRRFRKTLLGGGMHIELPWPAEPPTGRRLDLYIRYVTPDGRRLYEQKQIMVDPLPEALAAGTAIEDDESGLPPLPQLTQQSASEVFGEDRSTAGQPAADTPTTDAGGQWNRRTRPQTPTPAVEPNSAAQSPAPATPHKVAQSAERTGREAIPTAPADETAPAARTGQRTAPAWRPYR